MVNKLTHGEAEAMLESLRNMATHGGDMQARSSDARDADDADEPVAPETVPPASKRARK